MKKLLLIPIVVILIFIFTISSVSAKDPYDCETNQFGFTAGYHMDNTTGILTEDCVGTSNLNVNNYVDDNIWVPSLTNDESFNMSFDGSAAATVELEVTDGTLFEGADKFTWMCWVDVDLTTESQQEWFANDFVDGNRAFRIRYDVGLKLYFSNDCSTAPFVTATNLNLVHGEKMHLAITYNAGEVKVYRNGTLTDTLYPAGITSICSSYSSLYAYGPTSGEFDGNNGYEECYIADGKVLNQTNISDIVNYVTPIPDTTPPMSNISINDTSPKFNSVINVSGNVSDETALSYCWFYNNMSKTNSSLISLSGTEDFRNCWNTTVVNVSKGTPVLFTLYVNDTSNNLNWTTLNFTVANTLATVPTIISPIDNAAYSNVINDISLNVSSTDADGDTITYYYFINGTLNATSTGNHSFNGTDGTYLFQVMTFDGEGYSANASATFTIDTVNPIIYPHPTLLNNNSVTVNWTFMTQINFTDEFEIYSINVTLENGTNVFFQANMGLTFYSLNTSFFLGTEPGQSLTARVCDAHTAKAITDLEYKDNEKNGLKYIMKKNQFADEDWVIIYPEDNLAYKKATTQKKTDRYSFKFNKLVPITSPESFIVESSHYIDVDTLQTYQGHLIIPGLGENGYWIDFENDQATGYQITRISDKKIRITIQGITGREVEFNSIGELNCVTETYYYGNLNPAATFNSEVTIGSTNTFYLNVTQDPITVRDINATLYYNGAAYFAGTVANFSINITAPSSVDGDFDEFAFYWSVDVNGTTYNLTEYNQNVTDFFLDNCSTYTTIALNFSFFDEENSTILAADAEGTFNYNIGTGVNKEYNLNMVNVISFQMCIYPTTATLYTDYNFNYEDEGYPQRSHDDSSVILNNITQDIPLYLLHNNLGQYARFQTIDAYNNPLSGVDVTMNRTIGGVNVIAEQATTDDSGLVTMWVNPNKDYTFQFVKVGYETFTVTLQPTSTEIYVITLSMEGVAANIPYATGVTYSFDPTPGVLTNDTTYEFMFNLTSSYWNVSDCSLTLKNGSTTLITNSSSFSGTACDIRITYNTGNYSRIISEATYQLNGTATETVSVEYRILDVYKGTFSLKNFFDDLKAFSGAGFNDFTRMILVFIFIFSLVGFASSNLVGLRDPEALIVLFWALVMFFSYLGMLTLNYSQIPDIGGGWLNQYIIFVLVTLGAGTYIIKRHME